MQRILTLKFILFFSFICTSFYSRAASINQMLKIPDEIDVPSYTKAPFATGDLKGILVYFGRSGREGNLLAIYTNKKNDISILYSAYGVASFKEGHERNTLIIQSSDTCCGDSDIYKQITLLLTNKNVTLSESPYWIKENSDQSYSLFPNKVPSRIDSAYANIRSEPDKLKDANIIGSLKKNTEIKVVGQKKIGDTSWYWVIFDGDNLQDSRLISDVRSKKVAGWVSGKTILGSSLLLEKKEKVPFIGIKSFFFSDDGRMLSRNISIDKLGIVTIESCGEPMVGNGCRIEFKGKYVNPLFTDSTNGFLFDFERNIVFEIENNKKSGRVAKLE